MPRLARDLLTRTLSDSAVGNARRAWRRFLRVRRGGTTGMIRAANAVGLNVARRDDYYSPLPVLADLRRNEARWRRPSEMVGVRFDAVATRDRADRLLSEYGAELGELPDHERAFRDGFGPGYPLTDAAVSYLMLRDLKPRRYLEVGSGLSTYYASLAAARNRADDRPTDITCVEPYPYPPLRRIEGIRLIQSEVQSVDLSEFARLGDGDVLFIDSSHVLKIDSDVAFLFLEVLPRLAEGVVVHVHDVSFPHNYPCPADRWIFGPGWPRFWNEAMLLQAFLCHNDRFDILLSLPMLEASDHAAFDHLGRRLAGDEYREQMPSSIWLRRKAAGVA